MNSMVIVMLFVVGCYFNFSSYLYICLALNDKFSSSNRTLCNKKQIVALWFGRTFILAAVVCSVIEYIQFN